MHPTAEKDSGVLTEKPVLKNNNAARYGSRLFITLSLVCAGLWPLAGQAGHTTKASSKAGAKTAASTAPAFSTSPDVQQFIVEMHEQHGFDTAHLTHQFAAIHSNATVLRAIRPAAVPEQQRSWERYRARFVNERRINNGLVF